MNLKCLFGFHDWKSTYIGSMSASESVVGNVRMVFNGRDFYDNACQRCGKFVGPTWKYEREPQEKR